MSVLTKLRALLVAATRRERWTAEMEEEFEAHVAIETDRLVADGLPAEEARRRATASFGPVARVRDDARDARSLTTLDDVRREVRLGGRSLRLTPVVSLSAILTIALAIGATTALASAVSRVLLRPLPIAGLDRLAVIQEDLPGLGLIGVGLSPAAVIDLSARADLFESVAAMRPVGMNLTGGDEPRRVTAVMTIGDWFGVFGIAPLQGTVFGPEAARDQAKVVVLSHRLWQSLGGDQAGLIGKSLDLDGEAYTVLGVLTPGAGYPRTADVWIPFPLTPRWFAPETRGTLVMTPVVRPRLPNDGARLDQALAAEVARWEDKWPRRNRFVLRAVPFIEFDAGQLRPVLGLLGGAVALVLLLAAVNVANLQLVRATARARELAVRAALGAGRWSIARQLLVESGLLALVGGALGLGLAALVLALVRSAAASRFPVLSSVTIDPIALVVAALATIGTGLLFGLLPAWRASRPTLNDALGQRSGAARPAQSRLLATGAVVQVAIALVLLLSAAVAIRSFRRLISESPGFVASGVTTFTVDLSGSRYPNTADRARFTTALLERLDLSPGVDAAGMLTPVPLSEMASSGMNSPFTIRGVDKGPDEPEWHANLAFVSGDYFEAMGIPLVKGRLIGDAEPPGPIAAVIDETLARTWFRDKNPIGALINQGPDLVVVGVVGSVKYKDLTTPPKATIYYDHRRAAWPSVLMFVVRSALPAQAVAQLIRTTVAAEDPGLPVFDLAPMTRLVDDAARVRRFAMSILATFAGVAVVLALVGLYGVISYGVSRRTHELGVRLALGAEPSRLVRLVVGQGGRLALVGLVLGGVLFLGLGRFGQALVYGVSPRDPLAFAAGVLLLGVTALVAAWIPARRAARTPATQVLRESDG